MGALRAALVSVLVLAACSTPRGTYVSAATARGPYIDATLSGPDGDQRFLFPRSDACTAVLRVEAAATWSSGGSFGKVRGHDGTTCPAVGIGTLHRWRQPRREGEMVPSSPADWRIIHEDADVLLLRGRFPLASRVGVANTLDVVAMVPNDADCAAVVAAGNGTLVYRPSGKRVLSLGRCQVIGFATPR